MNVARHLQFGFFALFSSMALGCLSGAPLGEGAGGAPGGDVFSESIAVKNLSAEIESLERLARRRPQERELQKRLVDLLLSRSQYLGRFSDLGRALEIAESTDRDHPESRTLRARVLSALHLFQEASKEIDGLGSAAAISLKSVISVATATELERVLHNARTPRETHPSYSTHLAYATALSAIGEYELADSEYAWALTMYKDVSPFPRAFVAFQRGLMWSEMAGESRKGFDFYREAVTHLPEYVVANVHLAEIEMQLGLENEAIHRLERVARVTEDPEPASRLAEYLRKHDAQAAHEYRMLAFERYEELLGKHEEAFADHAAEFFMGPGSDSIRARDLAVFNLELRRTSRSHDLAVRAALNANDIALACQIAASASGLSYPSKVLEKTIEEISEACASE